MIIDELKKQNIEALKARDQVTRGILSVVLTKCKLQEVEMQSKGLQMQDSDVLSIIQKVLKELSDEKDGYLKVENQERADNVDIQAKVLESYLPKQLSEEEIRNEIAKLEDKSMPSIMKYFKTNFAGKVDMSLVSKIAREL